MLKRLGILIVAVLFSASLGEVPASAADYPFSFRDVGDADGLFPDVAGIRGHGAAWGDVLNNGYPSLFVTNFHDAGSKPAMLFLNDKGKFKVDTQEHLHTSGAGSGALFVDLTNNGRLDLYVSNCVMVVPPKAADEKEAAKPAPSAKPGKPAKPPKEKTPEQLAAEKAKAEAGAKARAIRGTHNFLFRNDGDGKFTDVSKGSNVIPAYFEGRGVVALDADGDGLLDLAMGEQYYSSNVKTGVRLFKNLGKYKFKDVSEAVGLPPKFGGLSVVAYDMNNDTWPDLFLNHGSGEHRLYLNDKHGKFVEAPGTAEVFKWVTKSSDDTPAGTAIGDVNGDGWADVVIGNHFKAPWQTPAPVKLYLNRGLQNGKLTFEDVSESAGVTPLAMKAPHVEIQDFDNDGLADIYTSIVKFKKDGTPCPVIFKNRGVKNGLPTFSNEAWAVNDFPSDEDKATKGSGPLFKKILEEHKIQYMAPGPTADFDRDGKVDMFLANWWIEDRSLLLRNETSGGNYLDVIVEGKDGVNRMGIGSKVNVYPAGKLKDAKSLLGSREISVGHGYCSAQEAVAHFGLGKADTVDVEVILPHGKGTVVKEGVKANQRLTVTK